MQSNSSSRSTIIGPSAGVVDEPTYADDESRHKIPEKGHGFRAYDHQMLVGRQTEIALLRSALTRLRTGRSHVHVVTGEPGIGKGALLAPLASTAAAVLTTAGAEDESDIAYVDLADLVRAAQTRLGDLPAPYAAALASVLAVGPAAASDRFTLAAGTLSLIGALAETGPVLSG